jgi:hypothetical protein
LDAIWTIPSAASTRNQMTVTGPNSTDTCAVPRDCTACEDEADNRHALEHMAKVCKADTGASAGIDFARLQKAA